MMSCIEPPHPPNVEGNRTQSPLSVKAPNVGGLGAKSPICQSKHFSEQAFLKAPRIGGLGAKSLGKVFRIFERYEGKLLTSNSNF